MIPAASGRHLTLPIVILLLLSFTVPAIAGGWNILPVLGYSSSSGFQLGGLLSNITRDEDHATAFTALAWYGTKGALTFKPEVRFFGPGGTWTIGASYVKNIDSKWYGWGNNGDNDSLALYDRERQTLYGALDRPLGSGFLVHGGIEVRHSCAFAFEDSLGLFDSSPSDENSSIWTVGPSLRLTHKTAGPLATTVSIGGFHQLGEASYSEVEIQTSLVASLNDRTSTGLNLVLTKHFDTASTPFPFLPSLGGDEGLRGFSGDRFRGAWTCVANLELRRTLFLLKDENDNEFGLGAVLFTDIGQVGDEFGNLRLDRFHFDAGVGLRSFLPGGALMRVDVGWSNEGMGIQTGFSELF